MRVKILKNPVGLYSLSYEVGEVWNVADELANRMIKTEHAEQTTEPITKDDGKRFATLTGADGKPTKMPIPNAG